jgi:starch synthase
LRILYVTSEAYPLVKTGGLADVSGSLPSALRHLGEDVRILIPGYPQVLAKLRNTRALIDLKWLPMVGNVQLVIGEMPDTGVPVIAIDHHELYQRDGGPYLDASGQEWADNPLRFGTLSRIAAILSSKASPLTEWIPDIVHINDWQSGLTAAYMHHSGTSGAKSVLGIHNLAFQGNFPAEWVERLGLPKEGFTLEGFEFYGQLSFLKAGIYYADKIATVSPTYAKEIQTAEYGFGMQGLLAHRSRDITGILNGIDVQEWDPATDRHLPQNYTRDTLDKKSDVKLALQQRLGLNHDPAVPLLGVVSRLTHQKGLDLLLHCAPALLEQGCQVAVLGGGDPALEQGFQQLALKYPQQVSVTIGYNEPLSHLIMAGVDMFIMPSRFEPCGLNQMYGLRYGTPPVVRRTGGLADSVHDTTESSLKSGIANGFVFDFATAEDLLATIRRALGYLSDSKQWRRIQKNGMATDLGWDHSAQDYLDLYRSVL